MDENVFSGPEGAALGIFMIAFYGMGCLAMILGLVAQWKIFSKTGNSGALSLLMLVPLVGIAVWLWLAFSEWPIERELAALKGRQRSGAGSQDDWD